MRPALRLVLVAAAALAVAGCFLPPGDPIWDCNCPQLTELVASIDWTGDGTEPDSVGFSLGDPPKPLQASAHWRDVPDDRRYRQAVARMTEAGYQPVEIDDLGGTVSTVFETDTWQLRIGYSGGSESLYFVVWMAEPGEVMFSVS